MSRRRIATLLAGLVAVLGLGAYLLAGAPPGAGFAGFAGIVCVLLLIGLSGPREPMPPGPS